MYFETQLLVFLIGAYHVLGGRRFLSLERIAEPVFAVNLCYLLNFAVRTLVVLLFENAFLRQRPFWYGTRHAPTADHPISDEPVVSSAWVVPLLP